ncbi:MAG TPA: amidase family protein, partial [Blastocatellia bacterium]|nr:amidase family protein [Blastocatellia bacterium]
KQSAAFSLLLSHPVLAAQATKQHSQLAGYDALGLADLIKRKQVSPLEMVDDVIRRVEKVNPKINAVLTKNLDIERVRDRAKGGALEGPFAGVPVMLKNLQQYKDATIDSGSRLFAEVIKKTGNRTQQNSPLVDAMERSGMIITGITNSPELGLIDTTEPLLHGPTRNPWNLNHTAGGSSGGTAAAIAAGIVPLAHGNDGGGSIRIPACQCGVFGLKPTRAREVGNGGGPRAGGDSLNISSNLCLSRTVRDTAAYLSVVENKNNPNLAAVGFVSGPAKTRLRIALVINTLRGQKPHREVEKAANAAAKLCESLGHRIEPINLAINGEEFIDAFIGLWASGTIGLEAMAKQLLGDSTRLEEVLEPWTLGLMEVAKSRGVGNCLQRATKVFGEVTARIEKTFQSADVILSPVMTTPPYKIGWHDPRVDFKTLYQRVIDDVGYTPLHNACGTTAMSVPLHWTADGLPVGSQFAAWRGGESTLLQLAYELEAARPWARRRPPVFAE